MNLFHKTSVLEFFRPLLDTYTYLVLMTSTGEANNVAVNPATTAAEKWQGVPSLKYPFEIKASFAASYTTVSPTLMIQFLAMLGHVPV